MSAGHILESTKEIEMNQWCHMFRQNYISSIPTQMVSNSKWIAMDIFTYFLMQHFLSTDICVLQLLLFGVISWNWL